MSLEKEAQEYLIEKGYASISGSGIFCLDEYIRVEHLADFATQQTENLRDENKRLEEKLSEVDGKNYDLESKDMELQQTKEKLKRCEEVIEFAHEVLSCFEFSELWNHGFNKDFVLSQLKDNG